MKGVLRDSYVADLERVIAEIEKYEDEADLWKCPDGIPNSAANLALHLTGNIKHFFGANLGGTGYQREREEEFTGKGATLEEIIAGLREAISDLKLAFDSIDDTALDDPYPEEIFGGGHSTGAIAVYMLAHLNYHLGQINYHRRLLTNS